MTSLQPSTTFAPPAIPFLASSAELPTDAVRARVAAALFGAPLDLTESFRRGAHAGPSAVRHVSDVLESYSPVLDRDLADFTILDMGDLELNGQSMANAQAAIADAMAYASQRARLAIMLGGEH